MVRSFPKHYPPSQNTSHKGFPLRVDGEEISFASKVWQKNARSEGRIELLTELMKYKIGVNEVENICEDLKLNYRSRVFKGGGGEKGERKLVHDAMKLKRLDEIQTSREIRKEMEEIRDEFRERFGKNTRKTRTIIKNLQKEAAREKREMREKYRLTI